jgi:Cof subfamily protein (haloacid dehalogenase superfamily)
VGIKALFIDMDGTLLTRDNSISPRNLAVLQHLKQQGMHVFLATGRQMDITFPYHQMLGLSTPMICLNGAAIYESFSLDPLLIRTLTLEPLLHELVVSCPGNVIIHSVEGMYCKRMDNVVKRWITEGRKEPVYIGDLKHVKPENALKYSIMTGFPGTSFDYYFVDNNDVIRWQDGIEIVPKGVSKWSAMQYVMNKYHLSNDMVMAFGDGPNDSEMLREAGTGVAMGNATDEVKRAADFVTGHHEQDGLADFIEKHLLKPFAAHRY